MAEILVAASTEMVEAAAWYDDRVAGLGERFLLEAEAAFARIDEKPLTGPPWKHRRLPEGVRRMFMRSFRTRPFTFSSRGSSSSRWSMHVDVQGTG